MAGYSGTPLPLKLGIKPDHRLALIHAPDDFRKTLGPLPAGVDVSEGARGTNPLDLIFLFAASRAALVKSFESLSGRLTPAGGLWVAWPKKSSGVATDLNENIIREFGLQCGLVDNKVCAVDDTWSGLRFVRRLKDRPAAAA